MLHQGKLKNWDPIRGCGLIQRDNAGPHVWICNSGFRQKPEQLRDGDSIFFQIEIDSEGKPKAIFAYKAGQQFAPVTELRKPTLSSLPFQQLLSLVVGILIVLWLVFQLFQWLSDESLAPVVTDLSDYGSTTERVLENPVWPPIQLQQSEPLQCSNKIHCVAISSCEEVRYYLKNCPELLIQREQDALSCEQLHCGPSGP